MRIIIVLISVVVGFAIATGTGAGFGDAQFWIIMIIFGAVGIFISDKSEKN